MDNKCQVLGVVTALARYAVYKSVNVCRPTPTSYIRTRDIVIVYERQPQTNAALIGSQTL